MYFVWLVLVLSVVCGSEGAFIHGLSLVTGKNK